MGSRVTLITYYLLLPPPEAERGVWQCPTCVNVRFSDPEEPVSGVHAAFHEFVYHVDTTCGAKARRHNAVGKAVARAFRVAGIVIIAEGVSTPRGTACLAYRDAKGKSHRLDAWIPYRGLGSLAGSESIAVDYKGIEATARTYRVRWGDLAPAGRGYEDPDVYLAVCVAQRQHETYWSSARPSTDRGARFWAPVFTSRGAAGDDMVRLLRRYGQSTTELHPRYWTAASARTRLAHRLSVALHTARWGPVHEAAQEGGGARNRPRMEALCEPALAVPGE